MLGTKILTVRKSKFNGNLRVIKSFGLGTYIQAGGLTQSGGIVETFWKQTLKKIKSQKSNLKTCLILGLGGGSAAKIIRKYWPEAKITGIDIDPVIVELGREYLGLDEFEVDVVIMDAAQYAKYTKYDLVIVDLYNGDNSPKRFETKYYIQRTSSLLAHGGIVVFNRLYYKDKKILAEEFGEKLKKIFKKVECFRPVSNIMYICTN